MKVRVTDTGIHHVLEFSRVYQHSKFEINPFINVPTQNNANHKFYQITSAEFSPMTRTLAK